MLAHVWGAMSGEAGMQDPGFGFRAPTIVFRTEAGQFSDEIMAPLQKSPVSVKSELRFLL